MPMPRYLAIDLGATNLCVAVADADGTVHARKDCATPQGPDGQAVTDAILASASAVCESAGVDPEDLRAAGVGSIGPLDRAAGAVVDPPNVPVERIELVDPLAELLATDAAGVALHNDADAGAMGERRFADAPAQFVYLTISTGIGAGAILDGRTLSGWRGNAAEIGHVVVDPDGDLTCGCGGSGHWEGYCSGAALPRLAALLAAETDLDSDLPVRGDGGAANPSCNPAEPPREQPFDAADVFARAETDPLAELTLAEFDRLNALGFAAAVHAFAPQAIRVGGAVALANADRVLAPVRDRLPAHLTVEPPQIEEARLGTDAVLLGALAAALAVDGA